MFFASLPSGGAAGLQHVVLNGPKGLDGSQISSIRTSSWQASFRLNPYPFFSGVEWTSRHCSCPAQARTFFLLFFWEELKVAVDHYCIVAKTYIVTLLGHSSPVIHYGLPLFRHHTWPDASPNWNIVTKEVHLRRKTWGVLIKSQVAR